MFLFKVKVDELDQPTADHLHDGLKRGEQALRAQCPIRDMSLVGDTASSGKHRINIYFALDDVLKSEQLSRLMAELNNLLGCLIAEPQQGERVSSELIHI